MNVINVQNVIITSEHRIRNMNGFYYIIGIALILIFIWLIMLTINIVYGQNTSPLIEHKYGGADSTDLDICGFGERVNCDTVPQNTKIPIDKIPFEDSSTVKTTLGKIYT